MPAGSRPSSPARLLPDRRYCEATMMPVPEDLDELLAEADAAPPRLPRSRLHPSRRPGSTWDRALELTFGITPTNTTAD